MARTSSRSTKRKETKPYYKYGRVYRNKDQYKKYRSWYLWFLFVAFLITLIITLVFTLR